MKSSATLKVAAPSRAYDIVIGSDLVARAGQHMAGVLPGKKICVVTDEAVARLYLMPLMRSLEMIGFQACPPVILPPGEGAKDFRQFQQVLDRILSYKIDRTSSLVALGGGVVGDITGFAASILLRGIPYVQVPTTLLAQVDSSVGGKTGLNTAAGKNTVGSFYQPALVLADVDTLKSLPVRELRAGYAEILKYALIGDKDFYSWLEEHGREVLAGAQDKIIQAVKTGCAAKADIVRRDEKEQEDIRALLNLGHTFGHALESLGGYDGRLLHGEAVAIGLRLAFAFSAQLGICKPEEAQQVADHLATAGLPVRPPFNVKGAAVFEAMRSDKKNRNGKVTLVLVKGIGKAFVSRDLDENQLGGFLEKEFG